MKNRLVMLFKILGTSVISGIAVVSVIILIVSTDRSKDDSVDSEPVEVWVEIGDGSLGPVYRYVDEEAGMLVYLWAGETGCGIDTVPLSETSLKVEKRIED